MEGIRRDDEHIDKIINNPEPPTFDNTIIEEDDENEYYALLDKVSAVFFNLLSAETNDEMDALAQKIQPALTKLRKNEEVALSVLLRICEYLDCNIGDICDAVKVEGG